MICEICGAEMVLQNELTLNFTSPALKAEKLFRLPDVKRNIDVYTCECGYTKYLPKEKGE